MVLHLLVRRFVDGVVRRVVGFVRFSKLYRLGVAVGPLSGARRKARESSNLTNVTNLDEPDYELLRPFSTNLP
jgi:hypothetical protein